MPVPAKEAKGDLERKTDLVRALLYDDLQSLRFKRAGDMAADGLIDRIITRVAIMMQSEAKVAATNKGGQTE